MLAFYKGTQHMHIGKLQLSGGSSRNILSWSLLMCPAAAGCPTVNAWMLAKLQEGLRLWGQESETAVILHLPRQ